MALPDTRSAGIIKIAGLSWAAALILFIALSCMAGHAQRSATNARGNPNPSTAPTLRDLVFTQARKALHDVAADVRPEYLSQLAADEVAVDNASAIRDFKKAFLLANHGMPHSPIAGLIGEEVRQRTLLALIHNGRLNEVPQFLYQIADHPLSPYYDRYIWGLVHAGRLNTAIQMITQCLHTDGSYPYYSAGLAYAALPTGSFRRTALLQQALGQAEASLRAGPILDASQFIKAIYHADPSSGSQLQPAIDSLLQHLVALRRRRPNHNLIATAVNSLMNVYRQIDADAAQNFVSRHPWVSLEKPPGGFMQIGKTRQGMMRVAPISQSAMDQSQNQQRLWAATARDHPNRAAKQAMSQSHRLKRVRLLLSIASAQIHRNSTLAENLADRADDLLNPRTLLKQPRLGMQLSGIYAKLGDAQAARDRLVSALSATNQKLAAQARHIGQISHTFHRLYTVKQLPFTDNWAVALYRWAGKLDWQLAYRHALRLNGPMRSLILGELGSLCLATNCRQLAAG